MMHFTGEAPLIKSVNLLYEPALIKVLTIKEKDLEQVARVTDYQPDDRVVGRVGYYVLVKRGQHLVKIPGTDWQSHISKQPPDEIRFSAEEKTNWWEAVNKAAAQAFQELPQVFTR